MGLRIVHAAVILTFAASLPAQSLGEIAEREKKRREANRQSGASVRTIDASEIRPAPPVVTRPGTEEATAAAADLPAPPPTSEGEPAPEFSLPDGSGRTFTLQDFRGRPVLLDFWATWCGPCRRTMPELEKLHRAYRGRLQVVGINLEGDLPEVRGYLAEGGYTFQVLFDEGNWESVTAASYGVRSIPRTFLLDRDGRILYEGHPSSLTEETIRAAIAAR